MSILLGLNTAIRALLTQQVAIATVSHNVANANTPGFTRQDVVMETTDPFTVPTQNRAALAGQIGTGVTVRDIRRIRDLFLDTQFRLQSSGFGYWDAVSKGMRAVENLFHEPSDNGLAAQLGQFWNSWRDLTNDPSNQAIRLTLREQASNLTASFRDSYAQMVQQRQHLDRQVLLRVETINSIAQQISALNDQIRQVVAVGDTPNDLRDRRDLLLDELSKIIRTSAFETESGVTMVSIGGIQIVGDSYLNQIETQLNAEGFRDLIWQHDGSAVKSNGGEIEGMLYVRDTVIPDKQADLDDIALTLITQVNAQHQVGYGLNDATGNDFFQGTGATNFDISAAIEADVSNIAAASGLLSPGDGSNAAAIAALQFGLLMAGGTTTVDDFYQGFISGLGVETQQATRQAENQDVLLRHIDDSRQSTSGVSLDEETANMVKFQRAFEGAARMITAFDEMLDTVINRMGLVGRG